MRNSKKKALEGRRKGAGKATAREPMLTTSASLPPSMVREIDEICAAERRNRSSVIRFLIEEALARRAKVATR